MKIFGKSIATLLIMALCISFLPVNFAEAKDKNKPSTPVFSVNVQNNGIDVKVTIDKNEKAKGYSILMKAPGQKKFKSVKTLKKDGTSQRSYTIQDLAEGEYSFKVRAYNTVDGKKVWSSYSKAKKVELKSATEGEKEEVKDTPIKENPVINEENKGTTYVLNTNTMKFHKPSCNDIKKMKKENRLDVSWDRETVTSKGYKPCGHCNP